MMPLATLVYALVCACAVKADVYSFSEAPEGDVATMLKIFYIDATNGPASVDVTFNGGKPQYGKFSVVFLPLRMSIGGLARCLGPDSGPVVESIRDVAHVEFLPSSSARTFESSRVHIFKSGVYGVYLVTCGGASGPLDLTVSGDDLGANERSWSKFYIVWAILYLFAGLAWAKHLRVVNAGSPKDLNIEIATCCLTSLFTAIAGATRFPTAGLYSFSASFLMTSFMLLCAGGKVKSQIGAFTLWLMVYVPLDQVLKMHQMEWEGLCVHGCPWTFSPLWRLVLVPIALLCFSVSCFVLLMQTMRALQETPAKKQFIRFRSLGAVVVAYLGFFGFSLTATIFDRPSDADPWTFHVFLIAVSFQFSQAFGLLALLVLSWGLNFDFAAEAAKSINTGSANEHEKNVADPSVAERPGDSVLHV